MTVLLTEMPSGTQLKLARAALGMSRGEVSAAIDYSVSNLANVEEKGTLPNLNNMRKLVVFYTTKGVEFAQDGWVRLIPSGSNVMNI